MEPERKPPQLDGADGGADSKGMPQKISTSQTGIQELRDALLAELRRDLLLSKIATLQIERLGIALNCGLISVPQCLALQSVPAAWRAPE